jgi:L-serine dehydratase
VREPVGGSVEIPCISRNAMAAANAVVSANMVLGGFDPFIPFGEVAKAMLAIGRSMPAELRCTARGGLAATPTAGRFASTPREW